MIVTCPSCAARFTVADSALGPEGRKVKCSKCGSIWVQPPPDDPDPRPEFARAVRVAEDEIAESAEPIEPAERERRPPRERPRTQRPRRTGPRTETLVTWALFFAVLFAVAGGGYWFRAGIMRALPATAQIYALFDLVPPSPFAGLDLTDVTWTREKSPGGESVLLITGKVVNRGEAPKDVPALAGVLYDAKDKALHSWTFTPPEPHRLLPSQDLTFSTRVTNPDANAARLTIRFSEAAASGADGQ